MAAGLGWSDNKFNGAQNLQAAIDFIRNNSTDGTYAGYVTAVLEGKALSEVVGAPTPNVTNTAPGTTGARQAHSQTS
jgi:hypothetical protein